MKIHSFIAGPFTDGYHWYMQCLMTDGRGDFWEEDIYYDTEEEAELDVFEYDEEEIEEDYLEEDQ